MEMIIEKKQNQKLVLESIDINIIDKVAYIPSFLELNYSSITNAGLGIFAKENIRKGKFLGNYVGEILDNNKGGLLFKVNNHKDLASKILFFISNKNKNKKKLIYACARLHRFDYNKNLNKYYNLLVSIM